MVLVHLATGVRELDIVANVTKRIICASCGELSLDPHMMSCGNVLCPNCLKSLSPRGRVCPCGTICGRPFSFKNFENQVLDLMVKCPNVSVGCNCLIPMRCIDAHLELCAGSSQFMPSGCDADVHKIVDNLADTVSIAIDLGFPLNFETCDQWTPETPPHKPPPTTGQPSETAANFSSVCNEVDARKARELRSLSAEYFGPPSSHNTSELCAAGDGIVKALCLPKTSSHKSVVKLPAQQPTSQKGRTHQKKMNENDILYMDEGVLKLLESGVSGRTRGVQNTCRYRTKSSCDSLSGSDSRNHQHHDSQANRAPTFRRPTAIDRQLYKKYQDKFKLKQVKVVVEKLAESVLFREHAAADLQHETGNTRSTPGDSQDSAYKREVPSHCEEVEYFEDKDDSENDVSRYNSEDESSLPNMSTEKQSVLEGKKPHSIEIAARATLELQRSTESSASKTRTVNSIVAANIQPVDSSGTALKQKDSDSERLSADGYFSCNNAAAKTSQTQPVVEPRSCRASTSSYVGLNRKLSDHSRPREILKSMEIKLPESQPNSATSKDNSQKLVCCEPKKTNERKRAVSTEHSAKEVPNSESKRCRLAAEQQLWTWSPEEITLSHGRPSVRRLSLLESESPQHLADGSCSTSAGTDNDSCELTQRDYANIPIVIPLEPQVAVKESSLQQIERHPLERPTLELDTFCWDAWKNHTQRLSNECQFPLIKDEKTQSLPSPPQQQQQQQQQQRTLSSSRSSTVLTENKCHAERDQGPELMSQFNTTAIPQILHVREKNESFTSSRLDPKRSADSDSAFDVQKSAYSVGFSNNTFHRGHLSTSWLGDAVLETSSFWSSHN